MHCEPARTRSSSVTPPTTAPRWARWSAIRRSRASLPASKQPPAQGGTLLAGGRPYTDAQLSDGYFIAPTIVELDSQPADVWTEELFGPC